MFFDGFPIKNGDSPLRFFITRGYLTHVDVNDCALSYGYVQKCGPDASDKQGQQWIGPFLLIKPSAYGSKCSTRWIITLWEFNVAIENGHL